MLSFTHRKNVQGSSQAVLSYLFGSTTLHSPVQTLGTRYTTPVFVSTVLSASLHFNLCEISNILQGPSEMSPHFPGWTNFKQFYRSLFKTLGIIYSLRLQQTCFLHQTMTSSKAEALIYSSLNPQCLKPSCPKLRHSEEKGICAKLELSLLSPSEIFFSLHHILG